MLNIGVAPGQMASISVGDRTVSAKKPSTTLGIAARISRIGLTVRRTRGVAYSARKIAAPRPSGAATSIAMTAMTNVPAMSDGEVVAVGARPPRAGEERRRVHLGEEDERLDRRASG